MLRATPKIKNTFRRLAPLTQTPFFFFERNPILQSRFLFKSCLRMKSNKASKGKSKAQGPKEESKEPEMASLRLKDKQLYLSIHCKPNSKENSVDYFDPNEIAVSISAPAMENEANEEVVAYFSEIMGARKSEVSLVRGQKSREKVILIKNWEMSLEKTIQLVASLAKLQKVFVK